MRRKQFLTIINAIAAIIAVTPILGSSAEAQVKFQTLYAFTETQASAVHWTLTFDSAGNLYGTSCYGGPSGNGVIFKLAPNADGSWTESSLHDFTGGADGSCPQGALILDAVGDLYATAYSGGSYGAGNVFELTPNQDGSWTENVLYSFTGGADGAGPNPIIFGTQGVLYGTVTWNGTGGYGGVFKLTPNVDGSWAESSLYSFTGGNDGGHPVVIPIFDAAGSFYGMTQWGGAYGSGVVFQLTPNPNGTWKENVLHTFTGGNDGSGGGEGLVFDAAGNLYGGTWGGGPYGNGVVFKLTPSSTGAWNGTLVHAFTGGRDGATAGSTEFVFDSVGNLYATALSGGAKGYGVAYRLTPTSSGAWGYRVLHAFQDTPGANPAGGLVFDSAGNLYGTTWGDGSKTFGSVYEITP